MILEAVNIKKGYPEGESRWLSVLDGVSISVGRGQIVAVTGESGVGKSTLLHLLGLLDTPNKGNVLFDGRETSMLTESQRAKLRGSEIGFVFQFHHLLPEFSALENVAIPARLAGIPESKALVQAEELLSKVNLIDRSDHLPNTLSGGEQQRVALARALICNPSVLLADEPTGNLDMKSAEHLTELLFSLAKENGLAVVLATHNRKLASKADRVFLLESGGIKDITGG